MSGEQQGHHEAFWIFQWSQTDEVLKKEKGKKCRYSALLLNVKMANFAQLFYKAASTQGLKHEDACHFAKLKITKHILYVQKFIKVLYIPDDITLFSISLLP